MNKYILKILIVLMAVCLSSVVTVVLMSNRHGVEQNIGDANPSGRNHELVLLYLKQLYITYNAGARDAGTTDIDKFDFKSKKHISGIILQAEIGGVYWVSVFENADGGHADATRRDGGLICYTPIVGGVRYYLYQGGRIEYWVENTNE